MQAARPAAPSCRRRRRSTRAAQRPVEVPFEGRLDAAPGSAPRAGSTASTSVERLDLPRRPVDGREDHHQRLRERRGRVLGRARQLTAAAPRRRTPHDRRGAPRQQRGQRGPRRRAAAPSTTAQRREHRSIERRRARTTRLDRAPGRRPARGCRPGSDAQARAERAERPAPGSRPSTTHITARKTCGTSMTAGDSCALARPPRSAAARGNVMPNAFTKHAAASARRQRQQRRRRAGRSGATSPSVEREARGAAPGT